MNFKKIKDCKILKSNCFLLISCFVFFTIVQIIINPAILKVKVIFAEDGNIFIQNYILYGLKSFSMLYGGYLDTLSRIFAFLAVEIGKLFNSFIIVANSIKWLSICFTSLVCSYFVSDTFSIVVKSRLKRLFLSTIVLLLISNFGYMLYNGVCIHWWCGLLVFLTSLLLINGKLPSIAILPFVLISIISSASSLIICFAMLYYLYLKLEFKNIKKFWKSILKFIKNKEFIVYLIIGIFVLLQVYSMLFRSDYSSLQSPDLSITNLYKVLIQTFELTFSSILYSYGVQNYQILTNLNLNLFIGIMAWGLLLFFSIRNNIEKYWYLVFLDIFFLYFMILFKRDDLSLVSLKEMYLTYYHALPCIFCLFLISINLFMIKIKNKRYIPIVVLYIFASIYFSIQLKSSSTMYFENDISELIIVDKYIDYNSKYYAKMPILPNDGRYVLVPVKGEYCENYECNK